MSLLSTAITGVFKQGIILVMRLDRGNLGPTTKLVLINISTCFLVGPAFDKLIEP